MPNAVLEFEQVTFSYGRAPVLQDSNVSIEAGAFVAVIGANGSGKTTLLRLALGLLRPDSGEVRLFGTLVGRFDQWHRVGYVPQRASIDPAIPISVEEVVRTGMAAQLGALQRPSETQRRRVDHVLELLGLQTLRHSSVTALSGGQQQRVLIARALATRPELLVLDEPTTGVDAGAREVLRSSLAHLVHDEGVAVVYVSHDPEGFAGLADRVVETKGGQVLPCEDPWAHSHGHQ